MDGRDVHMDSVGCPGMPGPGSGDQSKEGLSPGALFLQDASVGCCRCLLMALMLQFLDIPQQAFFTLILQSAKKPDLFLCQIIIDSGESLFMQ